jgi:hypothetical protein
MPPQRRVQSTPNYKREIPSLFPTNELLIIADGLERAQAHSRRLGTLHAGAPSTVKQSVPRVRSNWKCDQRHL